MGAGKAANPAGEADAERRLEAPFDGRPHSAQEPVQLGGVHRGGRHGPDEQHGVLLADAERRPDQARVALQEVLVKGPVVLLRGGHDIGLVVEHPLPKGEPDGGGVLLLAHDAGKPPSLHRSGIRIPFNRFQDRVLLQRPGEPGVDDRPEGIQLVGAERRWVDGQRQAQSTSTRDERSSQIRRSRAAVADQVYDHDRSVAAVDMCEAAIGSSRISATWAAYIDGSRPSTR